jgi:superfamily II DNA/RNA helicase
VNQPRLQDIIAVYGKGSRAIVFTQTKRECDELAAGNAFKTLSSQVLHGDIGQNQREVTIGQFRKVTDIFNQLYLRIPALNIRCLTRTFSSNNAHFMKL